MHISALMISFVGKALNLGNPAYLRGLYNSGLMYFKRKGLD